MQREQQKEQQSRDIQQLSHLISRLNNPGQQSSQMAMPEIGTLVQQ